VNPHLGDFALDGLPVTEAASFCLSQAGGDADLSALVLERVEPSDELFSLTDSEHAQL
jgi:hypothetical protein